MFTMKVEKFFYNDNDDLCANTYVVIDDDNKCVIIDPSAANDGIINYLTRHQYQPVAVLLTHGHFDHIRGVDRLIKKYKIDLYVNQDDAVMLNNPNLNCSYMVGDAFTLESEAKTLVDGQTLDLLNDETIIAIHTPFHTKGSTCYYFKNNKYLFSGDTLFKESIGRDDLPHSDPRKIYSSLDKLKLLPKETKIFPGHGPNTVLESELLLNRFLYK